MTPPDKKRRPSARPAARPSSAPKPSAPTGAEKPPTKVEPTSGQTIPATKKRRTKKPRVAARRSTPPEATRETSVDAPDAAHDEREQAAAAAPDAHAETPTEEPAIPTAEAAVDAEPAAEQAATERAHPEPDASERKASTESLPTQSEVTIRSDNVTQLTSARPTAPARPTRTSATRAKKPVPEAPRVPADLVGDEDADIFGDGFAAGFAAPLTSATEPEVDADEARALTRLTKSSGEEKLRRHEAALLSGASELLGTDYYFRQYGAHGIRSLSAEVDDFGLDPHFEERARPALELLVKRYFRCDVDGAQHVPEEGRALIVANRSGALPWDGLVLRTAMRVARPSLPPVRWLAEDSIFHYPFLGVFMNRLGAVRACPENAERLLDQNRLVAVFPEGAHGSGKLFRDRYRLQRFGRGGYVKLALKHRAPIIPTAIIGAEETNPLLGRARPLARTVGASYLPITPTFPWLGPIGLLPAPVKWRIVVGEPVDLSNYGPDAADDALLVHRLNEQIRGMLQSLVDQARASRRSVLFG